MRSNQGALAKALTHLGGAREHLPGGWGDRPRTFLVRMVVTAIVVVVIIAIVAALVTIFIR
jgi:hypothetical protein